MKLQNQFTKISLKHEKVETLLTWNQVQEKKYKYFIYICYKQIVIHNWYMRYAFSFEGHNYTQGPNLYAMWNASFSITQIH